MSFGLLRQMEYWILDRVLFDSAGTDARMKGDLSLEAACKDGDGRFHDCGGGAEKFDAVKNESAKNDL